MIAHLRYSALVAVFIAVPSLPNALLAQTPGPVRGSLSYSGVVAGGEISGHLAYSGITGENGGASGRLQFFGVSALSAPIVGSVQFTGVRPMMEPVVGVLGYVGVTGDSSGVTGNLKFSGVAADVPSKGTVSFRGIGAAPTLPEGILAYSGVRPNFADVSGSLDFTGCEPEDRLATYINDRPPEMQDPNHSPFIGYEGNYIVEWIESGLPPSFVTLTKGGDYEIVDIGDGYNLRQFYREPNAEWFANAWVEEPSEGHISNSDTVQVKNNGAINIEWKNGHLGDWGGESRLFGGADSGFFGRWVYGDEGGSEYWTRVESQITRVSGEGAQGFEVREVGDPITLTTPYVDEGYYMRGNRLAVQLHLYGEDLWGRHYPWISRRSGLELDRVSYICYGGDETSRSDDYCSGRGGVIGLSISLNVWYDARSGLQKLYVDGLEIPFYLEVDGAPPQATNCLARG